MIAVSEAAVQSAQRILSVLSAQGRTLAVAESLTGGALAATIVSVPGASEVFRGGLVTYATELKAALLGVSRRRLAATGPVDSQVAQQMAAGAAQACGADYALATTGVAGPGSADGHAAGTVWIALHAPVEAAGREDALPVGAAGWEQAREFHFAGARDDIRRQSVEQALAWLAREIGA